MARCSCGGCSTEHNVGEDGCFRELVPTEDEPKANGNHWTVEGAVITDYTLKQQRLYHKHTDGQWSRISADFSCNSLPDET